MNIIDIDHIECYVGDSIAAAQSLCTAYGFRVYGHGGPDTGRPGQRSVLLGQGDIRMLLTSGLHKDDPASQFVARHGDGVAVIAFRTDGAATAYAEAVAAGGRGICQPRTWEDDEASVVTAEVAGFGDVVYRLVERHGQDTQFQPGAIEMEPGDTYQEQSAGADLLRTIDHAAVCVPAGELEATIAFHEQVFGFTVTFQESIEVGRRKDHIQPLRRRPDLQLELAVDETDAEAAGCAFQFHPALARCSQKHGRGGRRVAQRHAESGIRQRGP